MSSSSRSLALSFAPDELWTLHHVLLHRIDAEHRATDETTVDPPPLEVYTAFDTLENGETHFTVAELEAIRDVISQYHHRTDWWEIERDRLEQVLETITQTLERQASLDPVTADD
ncbi:hypothetical protein RBH26_20340 [Natronolimnohabitans sp. A-GB9]|uniref:DUF7853 family protein n=1 Tax=Natronolimnohabitans sp. A-GB9 TaxID=3069757 RepID=UPI0027B33779|nr:hypothetical protein [Natronolimnohabitans sp. A-GB9]MDQ2052793.1 hypothetical protein [Natronolimnohabitans sp. A-GB9]